MRRSIAVALALLAGACSEPTEPVARPRDPAPPAEGPREAPVPTDEVTLVRRSRAIMGTVFEITVAGMPEAQAGPLMERALDEIARLEDVLSEWRDDSEIGAINRAAGNGRPIPVGADTMRVVAAGVDVSRWSDGAFDLSWAALRGLYTFQPGERRVPPIEEVRARLPLVAWRDIAVDPAASTVRLARRGMAIGTGGIAKGYALDRAGAILREGGAESYMLYGGGQVQVHGMRGDRPWRVGIQHPRDPETYIGFLEATEGSISTSGDYEHAFVDARGRHWHHIIDLATGLPATRSMQVTLLAPEGLYADALSTAAFILGPERAIEMLASVPGSPEAVIIDSGLRMWTTPGTRERLRMRVTLEGDRLPGDARYRPR